MSSVPVPPRSCAAGQRAASPGRRCRPPAAAERPDGLPAPEVVEVEAFERLAVGGELLVANALGPGRDLGRRRPRRGRDPVRCQDGFVHQDRRPQAQRQQAAAQARGEALRLARVVAGDEERLLEGARQLLVLLARLPAVREAADGDPAPCGALLADLLARYPRYANLAVARADGEVVCGAVPAPPCSASSRTAGGDNYSFRFLGVGSAGRASRCC
jgi:hypothetical protein